MWWLWDDMRCACLMAGKEKGFVCYSFFFAMELWRAPGCIRQHCLVVGWLSMFHLETRYPRHLLIFIILHSSRDPIVLALREVFAKQIWNCNVVKQYCCTLKDQRPTGLMVGLSKLALTPFPDTPRAFVLPCQWCWSSAMSGWNCHSLLFPVHFQSWLHTPGREVENLAPQCISSCHCLSLHKQAPLAIDTLPWNAFPRDTMGLNPAWPACIHSRWSCKNSQQFCLGWVPPPPVVFCYLSVPRITESCCLWNCA